MKRLIHAAAAVAAALVAVVCTAPADPLAPHPRACDTKAAGAQLRTSRAVRLRAGRGMRARVLAVLPKNTDFYAECWGVTADDARWAYGEVMPGPDLGRRGWVADAYAATGYRRSRATL
ncbi:SH3 domain-containing protein [Streptomyces sennicomposti]